MDGRSFLDELVYFLEPVTQSVQNEETLRSFLRHFGYVISASDGTAAVQAIASTPLISSLQAAADRSAGESGVAVLAAPVFASLTQLTQTPAFRSAVRDTAAFSEEIFDNLTNRYVSVRVPAAAGILKAIGVITATTVKTTDPGGRDVDYTKIDINWQRLGDFVADNGKWAADVYGWGTNFDYAKAIDSLIRVCMATQLALPRKGTLTAAQAAVLLKNAGSTRIPEASLPFIQRSLLRVEADGTPVFSNEAGLKVVPAGDLARPDTLGLAIAPYIKGSATGERQLAPGVTLTIAVEGQAAGGAYVTMTPDGIAVANGTAVDAGFEFGITAADPDGGTMLLAGTAGATRLEAKAILVSVGGNLTGDFFAAGGLKELTAAIDVGEDGFLGALIPEPIEIDAGSILVGWRTGRGVYFDGGTSLAVTIPLNLDVGPVSIYELVVELDWKADTAATLMVTADARLGPLYAALENAGVVATLAPAADDKGLLGKYDLRFGFKPPTGYAVSLEADPIEGGGYLAVAGHEYRGALALKFQTFGLSAFAVLATKLPGGRDGFSMAALLFGEFGVPLGFGFFLTGVGGVIGINRTIDAEAMRDVLYAGRLDSLLFPADPIAQAATILDDMAAILPAREGQHLFGPVAKIGWGQPNLIDIKLGLLLEVGEETRLVILGGLGCHLPTEDAALVVVTMAFMGEIDFGAGTISFDASLSGSRVLSWPISGDAAIRSGWAGRVDQVAAFGGLHPRYPRPAGLPDLRRLSINFGTNNPKITLSAYQALTLNSLQFGARADFHAKGPKIWLVGQVAAEGTAYFDALIYFNPFAFDVALGGSLSLLVDGDVVCGLGFQLRLTGPNTVTIDGRVWATVAGIDVSFDVKHTWGSRQSLPAAKVDAVKALREALRATGTFEAVAPQGRSSGVAFRGSGDTEAALDPIGGARFVQRAVPLRVRIDKIGEAQVTGARTLDIAVSAGGAPVSAAAASLEFVRGHFFTLTDAERLRAPAFESHKAGFEIAADALSIRAQDAVVAECDYEVIQIPLKDDRTKRPPVGAHAPLTAAFAMRFMDALHEASMRPKESYRQLLAPAAGVAAAAPAFTTAKVRPGALRDVSNAVVATYVSAA